MKQEKQILYWAHMLDECLSIRESSNKKAYLSAVTKSGGVQIYDDAGKRLDRGFDFAYDRNMHKPGLIGIPGWSVKYNNTITALTDTNADADRLTFDLLARFMADCGYELVDER